MKYKKNFWWTNAISLEQARNDFLHETEDFCSYNRRDKIYRGYHSDSVSIAKHIKKINYCQAIVKLARQMINILLEERTRQIIPKIYLPYDTMG